ncbi:hypothetical protein Pmani_023134 [Petrolisthes manimaculis]|uniref:Uncharacterized protein n=1 Tax=Petrolisthes manimaculis TaxID=1843537 RepID=A0AAE1U3L7_9EUCA|nr:hypothetical protein Pmani_023134 [Petrolisthes manimaculis]
MPTLFWPSNLSHRSAVCPALLLTLLSTSTPSFLASAVLLSFHASASPLICFTPTPLPQPHPYRLPHYLPHLNFL